MGAFLTFWFWMAVGTPVLFIAIEVANALRKPGIVAWIRRQLPERKPLTPLALFLFMLLGWPFLLILIGVAARKGQSAMEYIAHDYEAKAEKKAKVEAAKREAEAKLLPVVEQGAAVMWTDMTFPGGVIVDMQAVRFADKVLPTHFLMPVDGAFCLYRLTNDFDAAKETPYARFPTREQAVAFCKDDSEWLRRRKRDLVKIIVGLVPNRIKFEASVRTPGPTS